MSMYDTPEPAQIDYHADRQVQRVARAKALVDVGDVIAIMESRLASQPDPSQHPLYHLVNWLLDREPRVDGAAFWQTWQQLCAAAVSTAIDDAVECLED